MTVSASLACNILVTWYGYCPPISIADPYSYLLVSAIQLIGILREEILLSAHIGIVRLWRRKFCLRLENPVLNLLCLVVYI